MNFRYIFSLQECWANPNSANPNDRGYPNDFWGKTENYFSIISYFFNFKLPQSSFNV